MTICLALQFTCNFYSPQECTIDLSNYFKFLFIIFCRNVSNVSESISSIFHYQAGKIISINKFIAMNGLVNSNIFINMKTTRTGFIRSISDTLVLKEQMKIIFICYRNFNISTHKKYIFSTCK